jgi:hypothetical protein
MEENLAKAFAEQIPPEHQGKTHGTDLTICIGISVNQEQIVPEGTPDPESEMPPPANLTMKKPIPMILVYWLNNDGDRHNSDAFRFPLFLLGR